MHETTMIQVSVLTFFHFQSAPMSSCVRSSPCAIIAILLMVTPANARATSQTSHASSCRYGPWSLPRQASANNDPTNAVGWTSIVGAKGRNYVAGNLFPRHPTAQMGEGPISVATLQGDDVGRPVGQFLFFNPQLSVDASDRLHLLWGEPADAKTPVTAQDWSHQAITSIWTAVHQGGTTWSAPRKVYSGEKLHWDRGMTPDDDGLGENRIALVPVENHRAAPGVLGVFRFTGDSIVASTIEPFSTPLYPSIVALGRTVLLALVAPARDRLPGQATGYDVNSVWIQRSLDGGATWEKEVLISRSGSTPAYELRLVSSPDGTLHLVWIQSRTDGTAVVRHVVSADSGVTWSAPIDLEVTPVQFAKLHVVVDACGVVNVIHEYLDFDAGQTRVEYATWDGRWSPIASLFSEHRVRTGLLQRDAEGTVRVVVQVMSGSTPLGGPEKTMYMERTIAVQ
jgi:hypothetical protein